MLALKLLLAPLLIALASLAGRRWGPAAAGVLGGLPLVAGPVVIALWLERGADYALAVASAAPAGVWANIVYMLAVGHGSARWPWYLAIPIGWAAYLGAALLLQASAAAQSLLLGVLVIPALWLAATRLLPAPPAPVARAPLPPAELAARMGAAALLVVALSTASPWLGADLTGILAGAPVAAVVIPAFTFALAGRGALLLVLRGFLTGLMGFAVFFLLLAPGITPLGAWAFAPALAGGLATGLLAARLATRPRWIRGG